MSTFKIAGKSFYEYVGYRLKKDGLGYLPSSRWEDGSTDMKTFIKAVVPACAYDFLVYCHELGHCKSRQFPGSVMASFQGFVDEPRLLSEFNAWEWAIRYVRRLGLSVTKQEWVSALNKSFKSYTKAATDKRKANDLIEKLNGMLDVDLEMESVTPILDKSKFSNINVSWSNTVIDWRDSWTKLDDIYGGWVSESQERVPKKTVAPVVQNKKHKPWMDLLDKQAKKHRKHDMKRCS